MARFLRFLLAVFSLPFAAGLTRALCGSFALLPHAHETLFSTEAICGLLGAVSFLVLWVLLPQPTRLYVLGHELTHALVAILFGGRAARLRVGRSGGSVEVSKSNVWITLAPYFFPFYMILVGVCALLVRLFVGWRSGWTSFALPWPPFWMFLAGLTGCFHVCFTLRSLATRQPDVLEYGRLFSWVFIYVLNVILALAWFVMAGASVGRIASLVWQYAAGFYSAVGGWLLESLRTLSVLQG